MVLFLTLLFPKTFGHDHLSNPKIKGVENLYILSLFLFPFLFLEFLYIWQSLTSNDDFDYTNLVF